MPGPFLCWGKQAYNLLTNILWSLLYTVEFFCSFGFVDHKNGSSMNPNRGLPNLLSSNNGQNMNPNRTESGGKNNPPPTASDVGGHTTLRRPARSLSVSQYYRDTKACCLLTGVLFFSRWPQTGGCLGPTDGTERNMCLVLCRSTEQQTSPNLNVFELNNKLKRESESSESELNTKSKRGFGFDPLEKNKCRLPRAWQRERKFSFKKTVIKTNAKAYPNTSLGGSKIAIPSLIWPPPLLGVFFAGRNFFFCASG